MKRLSWLTLVVAGLIGLAGGESALGWERGVRTASAPAATCDGNGNCWHGPYYHTAWGMPVALVVPPTAERQVHWGSGIGATTVTPICPQYQLAYPQAGGFGPVPMSATPLWPNSTDQFGVYYVRGPW